MEQSLEEIKEENNRLQELLAHQKTQTDVNETFKEMQEEEDVTHLLGETDGIKVEASLDSQVLLLHQEGYTAEEIARKLNCGKTEAELIIKMYAK
jgi:response regulator of citrate/malate metabolism